MTTKSNPTVPVIIERTFQAPASLIWKSLTEVEHINQWFFDLEEFRAEPGFEFAFAVEHDGITYRHRCRVTEVTPQTKIAYTWSYDGYEGESLVTYEIQAEGEQTRVKLTHEGLETFLALPAFARRNFTAGWTHLIGTSLKEYVEKPGHKLEIKREFDAPRDLVWKAWTEPQQMKEWLSLGKDMAVESVQADLQVGGKFRIQLKRPDGEYFTAAGTYREVTAPEKLVYTWDWEKDGAGTEFGELDGKETLVTVEFRASGERTELTLTHEKFAEVESRDRHVEGWNSWIDRMEKFLKA